MVEKSWFVNTTTDNKKGYRMITYCKDFLVGVWGDVRPKRLAAAGRVLLVGAAVSYEAFAHIATAPGTSGRSAGSEYRSNGHSEH